METRLHLNHIDIYPSDFQETRQLQEFEIVKGQKYEGKRIFVDNHQYEDCEFENCNFVHSGGHFAFANCTVKGRCVYSPTGPAYKTLRMFQALEPQLGFGIPLY